jgi:hypothetical protein
MWENKKNKYILLCNGNPEWSGNPFGSSRHRWNGNIIMFLKGVGSENVSILIILCFMKDVSARIA